MLFIHPRFLIHTGPLAALRRRHPAVRCCFMTGHVGSHAADPLWNLGPEAVFQKPFRLKEVTQTLRRILQRAG